MEKVHDVAELQESGEESMVLPMQQQTEIQIFDNDPIKAMSQMQTIVQAVSDLCKGDKFIAQIQDKQYPKVEWWTTVGVPLGLFPVVEYSRRVEGDQVDCPKCDSTGKNKWNKPCDGCHGRGYYDEFLYEAAVAVKRNGITITRAEAICSNAEYNWAGRDEYAVKSMAQTRATGKAYRMGLSMLAVLAGLEPTPADEVPPDGFYENQPEYSPDMVFTFGKKYNNPDNPTKLKDVDIEYLMWVRDNARDSYWKGIAAKELERRDTEFIAQKAQQQEAEETGMYDRITDVQLKYMFHLAGRHIESEPEDALHIFIKQKGWGDSLKSLTKSQAKEIIEKLEKRLSYNTNPADESEVDSLIELTIEKQGVDRLDAVEYLNKLCQALYGDDTIDGITKGRCFQLEKRIKGTISDENAKA